MLSQIHETFAWFVVASLALVGLWALGADRYPKLRGPWLWRCTWVAWVGVFIQVIFGVALFGQGVQITQFHMFYGFLCIISVAILYAYGHYYGEAMARYRYLLYGIGNLFIMGLALRAVIVGT